MKTFIFLLLLTFTFMSQATRYDQANWYVTMDMDQIREKVLPLIPDSKAKKHEFKVGQHLPQEMKQITFYGSTQAENDLNAVIHGGFNGFDFSAYLTQLIAESGAEDVHYDAIDSKYSGSVITEYKFSVDSDDKSFYLSQLNSSVLVLSSDKEEIQNWIDQNYDSSELIPSGLISVLINIENAMASMGADLKLNRAPFKSAAFQKIHQLSASVIDSGSDMVIEAALGVEDHDTAKQLEQIINGLVAMNALSNQNNDNQALQSLIQGLQINTHDKEIVISSQLPFDVFAESIAD